MSRIINAISQGDLERIQTHLGSARANDEDRGLFLQVAAKYGHKEIVRTLLTDGSIPLYSRYQAIKEAISEGHLHLFQELLPLVPFAILSVTGLSLAYLNLLGAQEERA